MTWIVPPYVLYGVKYIDLVSLAPLQAKKGVKIAANEKEAKEMREASYYQLLYNLIIPIDLGHAPYVVYGVKYIDLVSLAPLSG